VIKVSRLEILPDIAITYIIPTNVRGVEMHTKEMICQRRRRKMNKITMEQLKEQKGCFICPHCRPYTTDKGERIDHYCYASIRETKVVGCYEPPGGPWGPARVTAAEKCSGIGEDGLSYRR